MKTSGLWDLYRAPSDNKPSALYRTVTAVLAQDHADQSLLDEITTLSSPLPPATPEAYLDQLRHLLLLNLIVALGDAPAQYRAALAERVQQMLQHGLWREFQPGSALMAVCCSLTGTPWSPPSPVLGPSGAAPLETAGFLPDWQAPLAPYHAELGVLWAVYSKLADRPEYAESARQLAQWQAKTLDFHGLPRAGLLTREGTTTHSSLLAHNSLLFTAVGQICGEPGLLELARRQQEALAVKPGPFPPHLALLARWVDTFSHPPSLVPQIQLQETVCDPLSGLVAVRSTDVDIAGTLYGGRTGLGSFRCLDTEILTYGPHRLPLSECANFGIQQGLPSSAKADLTLQTDGPQWSIQGRVAVASDSVTGDPSGLWLAVSQEYIPHKLNLQATFHSLRPIDQYAFSFFVKAQNIRLDDGQIIEQRSLQHYVGPVQSLTVEGAAGVLHMSSRHAKGELHVVPLPGDGNFWGADFLIAHVPEVESFSYHWTVVAQRRK